MKVAVGMVCVCVALISGCSSLRWNGPESLAVWGATPVESQRFYSEVSELLSGGRQGDAEYQIMQRLEGSENSQRVLFLSGVLWRSRFQYDKARADFSRVYRLDPTTRWAKLGSVISAMDSGAGVEAGFKMLASEIKRTPEEPLLRWLFALEATYHKVHLDEARAHFEFLLEQWGVAPVAIHQSYGALLRNSFDERELALEHALLAVELEPSHWSYQGLAGAYKKLERFDDANEVYAKLLEMNPNNPMYWIQWGSSLFYGKDYVGAGEKFKIAAELQPNKVSALIFWGRSLEWQGRPEAGIEKYREALAISPKHGQVKAYLAQSLLYGYGTEPNFEAALELCVLPGRTALGLMRNMVVVAERSTNPISPEKGSLQLPRLIERAESGSGAAQYSLAMIYRYGIGVEEDVDGAMAWLERAAENGHAIAQRELGCSIDAANFSAKELLGIWQPQGSYACYEIRRTKDGSMKILGHSQRSGKSLSILKSNWDGNVLRFTTYYASTDTEVAHVNRMVNSDVMSSATILTRAGKTRENSVIWERVKK